MKSDSFLVKYVIILDGNLPVFLSNSNCNLLAEIKAISTPEKKAEKSKEIIATVSSNLNIQSEKFWESYKNNPSNVDVLFDNDFFAIDFRRANNHDFRKSKQFENLKVGHHIGIYGYQKKTLSKLCNLNTSKREINEKLEQLRWIENNNKIKCINSSSEHFGFSINTKEDLDRIRKQNIL